MTPEERRRKQRKRYARKKELRALLDRYADFAAYQVQLKKKARQVRGLYEVWRTSEGTEEAARH